MPWLRLSRWLYPGFPDPKTRRRPPACRPRVEDLEGRLLLSINEFPVARGAHPIGITAGPDGNLWFTEQDLNQIGAMAPDGRLLAEYPAPTANSRPEFIAAGPDGNLWFTEQRASKIGRITPDGTVTEFPTPTPDSAPTFITAGPDGNLWYADYYTNRIGRITPDGAQAEFELPTPDSHPIGITAGPDGNLWFTEFTGNNVGSISPDGQTINEYPLDLGGTQPIGITTGPDGNLWFAEFNYPSSQIATIAPDGTGLAEYPVPTSTSDVEALVTGPDGNIWFTDSQNGRLGSLSMTAEFQETATPTTSSGPLGITLGPDGTDLWFAEIDSNRIGQYVFDGAPGAGRLPRPAALGEALRNVTPVARPAPAFAARTSAAVLQDVPPAAVDLAPAHGVAADPVAARHHAPTVPADVDLFQIGL